MSSVELVNESSLSEAAKENITLWLTNQKFEPYKAELEGMITAGEWHALEDAFFRVLPFGTGGRRGTVGIGSNRVNKVTVGEAVQALCDYLLQIHDETVKDKGVAIAYDSRNTSVELSEYCATVLAANGYKAYLYDNVRSTPQLSFTVRHLHCIAGIVISASHNPSPDNGIKVYWNDGGQLVPPYDSELLAVAADVERIATTDFSQAVSSGQIEMIGESIDNAYVDAVLATSHSSERGAKIAYSPLHGAGLSSLYPSLTKAGFEVKLLESQANYDGNFTNVTNNISNPEVPAASDKVIPFAIEEGCDVAMTTDPDADRIGVVVIEKDGTHTFLNGNQSASLACYHLLSSLQNNNQLKGNEFIGKTIVTTDLLEAIATDFGVETKGNLLVGFKYIGELIRLFEDDSNQKFVFGGEESYGGLVGSYARDKDAASTALALAELASLAKTEDKTLTDVLDDLYTKYGYYKELLESFTLKGADGFIKMKELMRSLRGEGLTEIAGMKVVRTRDYLDGKEVEGRAEDVIRFEFTENGSDRITVRPSGTEPKMKVYVQTYTNVHGDVAIAKEKGDANARRLLEGVIELLGL